MLFIPIKFKTYVQLMPAELDSKYQEKIYQKLRAIYEGTCTKFGYIKPNSIEIVKRSCGNFVKQNFNGAIRFDVICRGEVCNPIQGSIVSAVIKNKNKLGILAESSMETSNNEKVPILDIIIPIKSAGIISEIDLDTLSIGDTIDVEVMGKKYQMKDKKISIIGRVIIVKNVENPEEVDEDDEGDEDVNEEDFDINDGEMLDDEDEDDEDDDGGKKKDDDEEDEEEESGDEENEFEGDELYEEDLEEDEFEGGDVAFEGGGVEDY